MAHKYINPSAICHNKPMCLACHTQWQYCRKLIILDTVVNILFWIMKYRTLNRKRINRACLISLNEVLWECRIRSTFIIFIRLVIDRVFETNCFSWNAEKDQFSTNKREFCYTIIGNENQSRWPCDDKKLNWLSCVSNKQEPSFIAIAQLSLVIPVFLSIVGWSKCHL